MLCESQPASEEERSQGSTGMQEEQGYAMLSMPEGAVSPARNSSCLPGWLENQTARPFLYEQFGRMSHA